MKHLLPAIVVLCLLPTIEAAAQVWPNEPAGASVVLDCPFNVKPTPSRDPAGCGIENFYNAGQIVQDGSAPLSPSNVFKSTLSVGASSGGSQLNFVTPQTYREMFVGLMWRTNPQFQGRQVGNKTFFMRGPVNNGVFLFGNSNLSGGAAPFIYSHNSSNLNNSHACALDIGLACYPNVGSGVASVGVWTKLEAYIKSSTTDTSRDGIVRWWVNGVLAGNYTNLNVASRGLNEWVWSETWDGTVNPVPAQEWAHFIDHLKISIPNCPSGGCPFSGGGGGTTPPPPPPPPLPPNMPTNLRVQ